MNCCKGQDKHKLVGKVSLWDNWGFEQKGMQMHRLERVTIYGKQEVTIYLLGCDSHKICSIDYGMVLMRPRFRAPCCLQGQSSALFSDLCWQERLREYTHCRSRIHRYCRWSKSHHFCCALHSNVPVILATASVQAHILMWTKHKCLHFFFFNWYLLYSVLIVLTFSYTHGDVGKVTWC